MKPASSQVRISDHSLIQLLKPEAAKLENRANMPQENLPINSKSKTLLLNSTKNAAASWKMTV